MIIMIIKVLLLNIQPEKKTCPSTTIMDNRFFMDKGRSQRQIGLGDDLR